MESMRCSRRFSRVIGASLVLVVLATLSACGGSSSSSSPSSASTEAEGTTASSDVASVGLAQPVPNNDHSFGEETHRGAVEAEEQLGVKINEINNLTTPAAQTTAVQNLARTNPLVILDGSIAAQTVIPRFPETDFAVLDGELPPGDNTFSVSENWHPVGYLAGIAAAESSKTGVVGSIGGLPIPVVLDAQKAYKLGAESVNPNIKVLETQIGSFTDSAKGKEAAAAQIANGADVIYADVDSAHTGIVQAATEAGSGVHVIGSVAPKCDISSGIDIGDTIFDVAKSTFAVIEQYVEGTLPHNEELGLKGGYSYFKLCPGAPAGLSTALKTAAEEIEAGKIDPEK